MINFFLRLKHWLLFSIIFALPFVFYMYYIFQMFRGLSMYDNPDIGEVQYEIAKVFRMMPYLILPFLFIFYAWFWSVGVGLQEVIRPDLRLSVNTFKAVLLIMGFGNIILSFLIFKSMSSLFENLEELESGAALFPFEPSLMIFFIPLYILLFVGLIYCLHFVAKTMRTAELQREVKFSDFVGEFVLFWFYIIGIWILQPRINKLINPVLPPPLPM